MYLMKLDDRPEGCCARIGFYGRREQVICGVKTYIRIQFPDDPDTWFPACNDHMPPEEDHVPTQG